VISIHGTEENTLRWLVSAQDGKAIPLDKVVYFETRESFVRVHFVSYGYVDLHHVDFDLLVEQLVMAL
jgi:hypothetical protein